MSTGPPAAPPSPKSRPGPRRAAPSGVDEQLRRAIEESGMSLTEVGEAAGVAPSAVMRFANGTRDLHLATATKICAALGMTLLQAARPARRAARPAARKNGG